MRRSISRSSVVVVGFHEHAGRCSASLQRQRITGTSWSLHLFGATFATSLLKRRLSLIPSSLHHLSLHFMVFSSNQPSSNRTAASGNATSPVSRIWVELAVTFKRIQTKLPFGYSIRSQIGYSLNYTVSKLQYQFSRPGCQSRNLRHYKCKISQYLTVTSIRKEYIYLTAQQTY